MKKTIKNIIANKDIIEGIVLILIGLYIGKLYITKWCPFDISTANGMAWLTVWGLLGWVVALGTILFGVCKICLIDETPKRSSRK